MKTLEIARLRPTQMTHGERQIQRKVQAYRALNAHELDMEIAGQPIAVVLGPRDDAFVIDHHHVANALMRIGVERVPCVLFADWSSLDDAAFWLDMENRGWVYPYRANGRRVAFTQMPARLQDAEDDEFRSLAASVRDAGAYAKTSVPLADFRWAEFFRAHFDWPDNDAAYNALIAPAMTLARSEDAAGLPGFIG